MSRYAYGALAGALALIATPARADGAACTAAEVPPTPDTCRGFQTFENDPLSALNPNDSLHLILYGAAVSAAAAFPWAVPIRSAAGVGALFGFAPASTQRWRLSVGGTFLFSEWGTDRLGDVSFEPRLRASYNLVSSSVVPIDVYLQGTAPYFFSGHAVVAGPGAGVVVRLSSMEAALGADFLFGDHDFGEAASPSADALRLFFSVGLDVFAASAFTARAPPSQTRVDLRCNLLAEARRLARSAPCAAVTAALEGAYAEPDRSALARFWDALPKPLQTVLEPLDERYARCVERHRQIQRWCVDCTKATLTYWFTYTVDPHQVAAALGCIDGVEPPDVVCAAVDADVAKAHDAECP